MTFELRFVHPCDHRTKSEPLIPDSTGLAVVAYPIIGSDIRILEENIEIIREPIVRSSEDDVDSLSADLVTNIDLITQEIVHNGVIEKRKYKQSRDFILSGRNLVLWKDTAAMQPNPKEIYFVSYRTTKSVSTNFRLIDTYHIKLSNFNPKRSYVADYNTRPEFCTKCQQSGEIENGQEIPGVVFDLAFNAVGDFQKIEGVEKLKQDLMRAVLAVKGSNPREPFYGTSISNSIGTGQSSSLFSALLSQEIRNSLGLLRTLHRIQASVQPTTDPAEILAEIIDIRVVSDGDLSRNIVGQRTDDPTKYIVSIIVENAARNAVDVYVPLDFLTKKDSTVDLPKIEIRDLKVVSVTNDAATLRWETNIETDTIVLYGETAELSDRLSEGFGLKHLITLSGLKADTLYYFKVVTQNRGFVFGADTKNFKTLP